MVDIGASITIAASSPLLLKLLGPTADYLGDGLRSFTEKGAANVRQILLHAIKRLGIRIEQPGTIPPRVLYDVINAGGFCEDEFEKEYFGGVLASSRSPEGKDDRGAIFLGMVSRMSNWEIRTHYIFYTIIRRLYSDKYDTFTPDLRRKMRTAIPMNDFLKVMGFDEYLLARNQGVISQIMWGLNRESFLERLSYDEELLIYSPTVMGSQLYLWALGEGGSHESKLLDPQVILPEIENVLIPESYAPFESDWAYSG